MERYEALTIEIVTFDGEDVVACSGEKGNVSTPLLNRYDDEPEDE